MDVTPLIPSDRQVIEAYGDGGFRVSGSFHGGGVIVLPDRTLSWPVRSLAELTSESLAAVRDSAPPVEILLLGCGVRTQLVPSGLRRELRAAGIVIDAMDTGAACRTYNVLLSEERRVAAALLPVG